MKFKSQVYTETSGSIGGVTYSRNRGGMYTRARAIPVNPGTLRQVAVRSHMASLTNRWVDTLTPAQRISWDSYAENVLLPDRLGEPRNVGGLGMYVRSNLVRRMTALPVVDSAPVVFNLGEYTPIDAPTADDTPQVGFGFETGDDWVGEDDTAMAVFIGRPVNTTVNYYKGPWRYGGKVEGDSITPPTSPATIASPFTLAVGQKVFFRVQVSRVDGRYSTSQSTFALVGSSAIVEAVIGDPARRKSSKSAGKASPAKV
jgi:hypothetical protein